MASLNVAEWTPEQVADWLAGLGEPVQRYADGLRARGVGGPRLLALRCDDLEALGVFAIGHQEIILEAVEQLRNFQYELRRECVQQLAMRVAVLAESLARALATQRDTRRLDTQLLADVARTVSAVKPLAWWISRWPRGAMAGGAGGGAVGRAARLLALALEAATCAQRDRFAEQPARAVHAAAAAAAAAAEYVVREVSDPLVLSVGALDAVSLRQRGKPLGFALAPSCCGHLQLADIRFGSPAHASGAVHEGDEIVQVGNQCVIGWNADAVLRLCAAAGALDAPACPGGGGGGGVIPLRLRRRAARPPPPPLRRPRPANPAPPPPARPPSPPSPHTSDSEPLSPPASPTLHPDTDHTRMYPPPPRLASRRRHSVSGASPDRARRPHRIDQFWQAVASRRWERAGRAAGPDDAALYHRDKAVSCSTGLERSPRGRTEGTVSAGPTPDSDPSLTRGRGKLDKAHSTPAYDLGIAIDEPALAAQPIPESPPPAPPATPSSAPAGAPASAPLVSPATPLSDPPPQAINRVMVHAHAHRLRAADSSSDEEWAARPSPLPHHPPSHARHGPPYPAPRHGTPVLPALKPVPHEPQYPSAAYKQGSPLKPVRGGSAPLISAPLRLLAPLPLARRPAGPATAPARSEDSAPDHTPSPVQSPVSSSGGGGMSAGAGAAAVRGLFPSAKTRSLKKKTSLLAKRRCVPMRVVLARGAVAADAGPDDDDDGAPADGAVAAGAVATGAGGALVGLVWQRVRAAHRLQPRWARRHLLLAHNLLYAYRSPESSRASCMVYLCGFTAAFAGEVRSRQHAFKVYHTGAAFYFATDSRRHTAAWLALIQRAALLPPLTALPMELSKQYSETEYSTDSGSDVAERERERDRDREKDKDRDKDKSKFGSLKKLTGRSRADSAESVAPAPAAASLDRKYLRFFSRRRDDKHKAKQSCVPVPTEHYRSYRRAEPGGPALLTPAPAAAPAPEPRPQPARLPKPINYIHASNPNLLDFEASSYVSRPSVPALPARRAADSFAGFVTLEEFMLKKQEEERRQVYTNRVLMGIERTRGAGGAGAGGSGGGDSPRAVEPAIHERLQRIVPDVIYGELPPTESPLGSPPAGGNSPQRHDNVERSAKVVVKGKDVRPEAGEAGPERWRDSLRRNDKVHSGSAGRAGVVDRTGPEGGVSRLRLMFSARPPARAPPPPPASAPPTPPCGAQHTPPMTRPDRPTELSAPSGGAGLSAVYPHLQCPPTFQPETYSLQPPPSHPQPHPRS